MEGNYRIVQLSDNEFVIEKEIEYVVTYPWYKFKKATIKTYWQKVDEKGSTLIGVLKPYYKASDLKTCQDKLRQILKYPAIIECAHEKTE